MVDFLSKTKNRLLDALLASDLAKKVMADADIERADQRREVLQQLAATRERHGREAVASAAKLKELEAKAIEAARALHDTRIQYQLAWGGDYGLSYGHSQKEGSLAQELAALAPEPLSRLLDELRLALACALSQNAARLAAIRDAAIALLGESDETLVVAEVQKLQGRLEEYHQHVLHPWQ